jgi:ankyrin repeat protein
LIYAVDRGYVEVVAELLKSPDLKLDPVDRFGGDPQMTPLSLAVVHGRVGIFQLLAQNSLYTIPEYIFRHALAGDNVSIVREILDTVSVALVWYAGGETETAIIYVVKNGSEEMLRYLLTRDDSNGNFITSNGQTALKFAMERNEIGKVRALLGDRGIDVNLAARYNYRTTVPLLIWAAQQSQHIDLVILAELLEHRRLDVNVSEDDYNRTALGFAAENGDIELLKLLIAQKDLNPVPIDSRYYTPLMLAAEGNHLDFFNLLLTLPDTRTDLWCENSDRKTILHLAAYSGHKKIVARLLDPALGATKGIIREVVEAIGLHMYSDEQLQNARLRELATKGEGCRKILQDHLATMEPSALDP